MLSRPSLLAARRRHKILLTSAAASLLVTGVVLADNNIWVGGTSSDYNDPTNWSFGRVPTGASGDSPDIRTTPANVATITGDVPQVVDIRVGESNTTGTLGTLNHSAGTLSSGGGNWTAIGAGNGGAGSFAIGRYNLTSLVAAPGTATGFAQGSGTLNANSRLYIGGTEDGNYGAGGNGTLNVNTTGSVNATDNIFIGARGATGTLNLDSGTINTTGDLYAGNNDGSTGTLRMTGGTINVKNWLGVGRDGANGTLTISGGTINQGTNDTDFTSRLEMTNFGKATTATVNLDGGTLSTNGVVNNGGGNTTFNFNGGVLQARIDNGGFMGGLTSASVKAGGAKVDTNGHNITIGQQLVGTAGDGGLTKLGNGTLALGASNTYNGLTTINRGTLQLNNGSTAGTLGGDGAIIINNGGTLASGAVDGLGYFNHTANNSITVNVGGSLVTLEGGRLSMDRTLNVIGGTVGSTGTNFDNGGSYAFRDSANGSANFYSFTSSSAVSGGVASTLSATNVGLGGNTPFNVTKGGGAVDLNVTGNLINLFGTGSLVKTGNGVMVLGNANSSYSGTTVFGGGIVNVATFADYGANSSLGNHASLDEGSGNVSLLFRGGTLQYTGATAQSTNRAIRVSTAGGAIIDASGSNPAATLSFTTATSPDFYENGGNRTLTLAGSNTGNNTFATAITETGGQTSVVKEGAGKWVLTGQNTYSGGTTVNAGRLVLTDNTTGSSNFAVNGELEFSLSSGSRQINGGGITGTGSLIKSGNGVLMLGGNASPQNIALTGATSLIDVQGGVLRNEYGNSAWGSNKAALRVGPGATFDTWDGNTTVDFLSGSGTINKGWSDDKTLTIGVNNGSGTFSGTIFNNRSDLGYGGAVGGNFSIVKQGSGTQVLTGASSHAGATTVAGGILQLGGAGTLSNTSGISISGGKLLVTSTAVDRINDAANIALGADGVLQVGGAAGASVTESFGQLSLPGVTGSVAILDLGDLQDVGNAGARLTFGGAGTWTGSLQVWNWTGTAGLDGGIDQLDGFAGASLSASQLAAVQFYSGADGATPVGSGATIVNGELVPASVPEPSSLLLLLTALWPFSRRRRSGQA